MARDIDRKLRVTAAVLGTITIKDLAAAFRRINPATPFDIDRAHKWMQGRASPRQLQLYEDWARLLDLDQPSGWIAESDAEAFLDAICVRHNRDRETLKRHIEVSNGFAAQPERGLMLAGTYACYSHAWSPYFRARIIRGELSIAPGPTPNRLRASYAEVLPTGLLRLEGSVSVEKRTVHLDLREPGGDAHFVYFLVPPTPPVSILAGLMCGATIIGPAAQPSVTRIAMVKLPAPSPRLGAAEAYLPPQDSIAEDLVALGLAIVDPAAVDRHLAVFLAAGNGLDQIPASDYQPLVESLDRAWLEVPKNANPRSFEPVAGASAAPAPASPP
ncbi:hypothetical protein ACG873_16350 [Mesorhizobium sp. AaZ16]|uniref:hypothetical protein n=1 Tax=Mesorhizobium sp. AaZ16 TaxID=3402289 RepID=UPI00374ED635